MKKIADISKYQGNVDWAQAATELEFCILRASCGTKEDAMFSQNAAGCTQNNIPFHAYHYLKATDYDAAISEAEVFYKATRGFAPLFYVIDCEHSAITNAEKKYSGRAKAVVEAFAYELRRLVGDDIRIGCYIGHHLYTTWNLDYSSFAYVWIPRYGTNSGSPQTRPSYPCDLWQYTSVGRLAGVKGNVDLNQINGDKPLSFFTGKEDSEMASTDIQTKRARAVELMTSRERHNSYTQGSDRKYFFGKPDNQPGNVSQKGYSDCSSATQKSILAAAGIDIGANTNAQIKNRTKGVVADQTSGYLPDESKLLPGDCLYFKGNKSHEMDVGHVEMYIGNGKICGHGSGTGPTIKDMEAYCKQRSSNARRYFMAIRWIVDGSESDLDVGDSTLGMRLIKLRNPLVRGDDVKELQELLTALGYAPGEIDGYYGVKTAAAVKEFQRATGGLEVDGDYGPLTHAALMDAVSALEGEASEDEPSADAPADTEDVPMVVITGNTVNVRKGPGTSYGIITRTNKGKRYTHIATARNGWLCIKVGDVAAWVSNVYAQMDA